MNVSKLPELLSLKNGINKIHMAILAILILIATLFSSGGIALFEDEPQYELTNAVLQAIKNQNIDKRLEYAESQPIIKSLKRPLRDFEYNLYKNRIRALGALTVIKQRFKYLRYKDLDTSDAERLLKEAGDKAKLAVKTDE
jgi:hypothetical protein